MHSYEDLQTFTLAELAPFFDFPINEAADRLGVCSTVLKKICRNNGVERWPHRKIKSINSMIESLQQLIDESGGDVPALNMDMDDLLAKKKFLLENPNTSYKAVVTKYAINSFNTKIQKAQGGKKEPGKSRSSSSSASPIPFPSPSKGIEKPSRPAISRVPSIGESELMESVVQTLANLSKSDCDEQKTDVLPFGEMNIQYSRVPIVRPAFTHGGNSNPLRISS